MKIVPDKSKSNIYFHFLNQPISYSTTSSNTLLLNCNRTRLIGEPFKQKAEISKENSLSVENGLILISTGTCLDSNKTKLPLTPNKKAIDNINGKIKNEIGVYCAGWCCTGGVGNIGDAYRNSMLVFNSIKKDIEVYYI